MASRYEITSAQAAELRGFEQSIPYSDGLVEHLGQVTILGVTSPSATGSTTLIERAGFYKVPGFTTRQPRFEGEDGIHFLPHTKATIDECIDRARAGNLVQVKLSQEGVLYGSEPDDYKADELNVADMHARSIISLLGLPIRALIPVVVVSEFDEWAERFERERGSFQDQADRLWADVEGLQFTADFWDEDHLLEFTVLTNPKDRIDETVARLVDLATGGMFSAEEQADGARVRRELIANISALF